MGLLDEQEVIVIVNAAIAGLALVGIGAWLARGTLSVDAPTRRQHVGEFALAFFLGKARDMAQGPERDQIIRLVAPLLACFFFFIFANNLIAFLPVPLLNRPPTSHFSVTLGLAICSVIGTLAVSAVVRGLGATAKHLFWPNPMQWVSEFTDVASLSLRLFGNIAGEFMTLALVMEVVPYGIPLILHTLGLIPAFVQALVFTLLTSSFIAHAIEREEAKRQQAPEAAGARTGEVSGHPAGAQIEGRVS